MLKEAIAAKRRERGGRYSMREMARDAECVVRAVLGHAPRDVHAGYLDVGPAAMRPYLERLAEAVTRRGV